MYMRKKRNIFARAGGWDLDQERYEWQGVSVGIFGVAYVRYLAVTFLQTN